MPALYAVLIATMLVPAAVIADPLRLSTTQNGTVSGDLYVGAFQNPPWANQSSTPGVKEFNQTFAIPAFTTIQWARLEIVVYAAGTDTRHGRTTVRFDGNGDGTYETPLGTEDQQTAADTTANVTPVNDHMDRQYSDYRIWYDVTSLITAQNPAAYIKTENLSSSNFDGRIKDITLLVAYNDGDSDQVRYWVNTGHDYQTSGASGITTSFNTTIVPAGFIQATLSNIGLSSKDATYTFNSLTPAGANPVAPFGFWSNNTWDVTAGITAGSASTFGYTNNGGSFKTVLAALTVRGPPLNVIRITPNTGAQGTTVKIKNLNGTGFLPGATANLTRGKKTIAFKKVTVVKPDKITGKVIIPATAAAKKWNVTVTNPGGISGTCVKCFSVTA